MPTVRSRLSARIFRMIVCPVRR